MSLAALTQAVEANLTAFHVALSDWPEITLHRDNDRIWTVSQRRFSLCNVVLVLRTGVERPFVAYVAVTGEEAGASSLVFFGAGVAGIYHVSTVPEHRGRGLGSVITAAPLLEARSRGY